MNEKTTFSSWLCTRLSYLEAWPSLEPRPLQVTNWPTDPPSQQTGWWGTKHLIGMTQMKEKFCNLVKQYTLYLLLLSFWQIFVSKSDEEVESRTKLVDGLKTALRTQPLRWSWWIEMFLFVYFNFCIGYVVVCFFFGLFFLNQFKFFKPV